MEPTVRRSSTLSWRLATRGAVALATYLGAAEAHAQDPLTELRASIRELEASPPDARVTKIHQEIRLVLRKLADTPRPEAREDLLFLIENAPYAEGHTAELAMAALVPPIDGRTIRLLLRDLIHYASLSRGENAIRLLVDAKPRILPAVVEGLRGADRLERCRMLTVLATLARYLSEPVRTPLPVGSHLVKPPPPELREAVEALLASDDALEQYEAGQALVAMQTDGLADLLKSVHPRSLSMVGLIAAVKTGLAGPGTRWMRPDYAWMKLGARLARPPDAPLGETSAWVALGNGLELRIQTASRCLAVTEPESDLNAPLRVRLHVRNVSTTPISLHSSDVPGARLVFRGPRRLLKKGLEKCARAATLGACVETKRKRASYTPT